MNEPILYDYWRSSAAYRVRIALNLKRVNYRSVPVHLAKGEQKEAEYRALNPAGLVPMLVANGTSITESLAIIEYLEETHPSPPLLPKNPEQRALVRAMAQLVACDIHPLNNLRVLKYLKGTLSVEDTAKDAWYAHWIKEGLSALEAMVKPHAGTFCMGDAPSMADVLLVPQLYAARRFKCPVDAYPILTRIDIACAALPEFAAAEPGRQPDAE